MMHSLKLKWQRTQFIADADELLLVRMPSRILWSVQGNEVDVKGAIIGGLVATTSDDDNNIYLKLGRFHPHYIPSRTCQQIYEEELSTMSYDTPTRSNRNRKDDK